jgi:hypothetical protein
MAVSSSERKGLTEICRFPVTLVDVEALEPSKPSSEDVAIGAVSTFPFDGSIYCTVAGGSSALPGSLCSVDFLRQ